MGFSDLLSSSRGPGVIGTMVAAVVLGGFGLLFFFVFDPGMQGKSDSLVSEVRQNDESIASFRREIARRQTLLEELPQRQADERDLIQLRAVNAVTLKNIADLQSDRDTADKKVSDAAKEFEDYKNAYRDSERAAAVGEKIPELKVNDGKVYTDVVIKKVDAVGMQISHTGGLKRIEYKLLPEKIQDRFQFDEALRNKAVEDEDNTKKDNNKNADVALLTESLQRRTLDLNELRKKIDADSAALDDFRANIPKRKAEIAAYRNLIAAEERKPVSKAPAMRPELQRKETNFAAEMSSLGSREQAIKDNRAKISGLQTAIDDLKKQIAARSQ